MSPVVNSPTVFHQGVLRELQKAIGLDASVLEIGSTDFSYRPHLGNPPAAWTTVDLFPPADLLIDLDQPQLHLPLNDCSYQIVVCTEVLEHLRYATALVEEIYRVLTPSGTAFVSVPNIASLTYRVAWLFGHIPSCAASADLGPEYNGTGYWSEDTGRWAAGHVGDYNLPRLRSLLTAKGFARLRFKGDGLHHKRQITLPWLVPVSLSSTILAVARKPSFGHSTT